LGRTTTSLSRLSLSLSNVGFLSSSLSTRSPLGLGVGLGGRLSSLLNGGIGHGLLGTRSSLSLDGLLFLLGAVLVGLLVDLVVIGGLAVLGARSLLHLLSRLGDFVLVTGGAILLGLVLRLLGGLSLVISRLWACQYKNR
jgi:hypothetical protein